MCFWAAARLLCSTEFSFLSAHLSLIPIKLDFIGDEETLTIGLSGLTVYINREI